MGRELIDRGLAHLVDSLAISRVRRGVDRLID